MKRILKLNKGRKSQNVIEVALIAPVLILIILAILEYGIFQRNVNAVQDIAVEAAVIASKHYIPDDTVAGDPFTENSAVEEALDLVNERIPALGLEGITFAFNDLGFAFGHRPFALYEFNSTQTVEYKGNTVPIVTFTIDYRDPISEGVSTQLIYHYNFILFGFEFVIPGINGGRPVVVIPKNIQLSSTQTKQYIHY